jgi:hypothetical protein
VHFFQNDADPTIQSASSALLPVLDADRLRDALAAVARLLQDDLAHLANGQAALMAEQVRVLERVMAL